MLSRAEEGNPPSGPPPQAKAQSEPPDPLVHDRSLLAPSNHTPPPTQIFRVLYDPQLWHLSQTWKGTWNRERKEGKREGESVHVLIQSKPSGQRKTRRASRGFKGLQSHLGLGVAVLAGDGRDQVLVLGSHRVCRDALVELQPHLRHVVDGLGAHGARVAAGVPGLRLVPQLLQAALVDRVAALEDRDGLDAIEEVLEAHGAVLHHAVLYARVALLLGESRERKGKLNVSRGSGEGREGIRNSERRIEKRVRWR